MKLARVLCLALIAPALAAGCAMATSPSSYLHESGSDGERSTGATAYVKQEPEPSASSGGLGRTPLEAPEPVPESGSSATGSAPGIDTLPGPALRSPSPTELYLDVNGGVLGAYSLILSWDPQVAEISTVEGGASRAFSGPPFQDPAGFVSGRTRILGLQVGDTAATGLVHVATVVWHAVAPGDAGLDVLLEKAVDPDGNTLPTALRTEPAGVVVER